MDPSQAALGVHAGRVQGERALEFGDGFVVAPLGQKDPALLVVRESPIWIDGERLRVQFVGPLEIAFRVAGNAKQRRREELDLQCHQGADIVGIDGERLFAERECRIRVLADPSGLPCARGALESQVLGVAIGRGRPFSARALGLSELKVECVR